MSCALTVRRGEIDATLSISGPVHHKSLHLSSRQHWVLSSRGDRLLTKAGFEFLQVFELRSLFVKETSAVYAILCQD